MAYGTIKVDTITFTDSGVDKSVSISGLVQNPTFSGNITVTGTVSGNTIQGGTLVSGATVTGGIGQFTTLTGGTAGFTTITGTTVTGTTANFASGNFTNISGGIYIITSGVFASGTAANPSISFAGDSNTGIYASAVDQVSITTSGTERLRVDAAGQIEAVSLGSASAPTYSFTTDPNTGIYSPGADQLAISTGGSGRLFVDSAGYVTIGTTNNPAAAQLIVTKAGGAQGFEFLPGSATTTNTVLHYNRAGSEYLTSAVNALDHIWQTGGTERLRITSAGLVGVGTSSPSELFQCQGNARFDKGGNRWITIDAGTNATYDSRIDASHTLIFRSYVAAGGTPPSMVFDTSGRLGVGTTAPGYLTHLATGASATASLALDGGTDSGHGALLLFRQGGTSKWFIGTDSTINSGTSDDLDIYTSGARAFRIYTNNQERLRVTSSGNVGIGTSAPQAPIHTIVTSAANTATEVARFSGSANGLNAGCLIRFTNTGAGTNPGPSQYNTAGIAALDDTNNFGGALAFYTPNSAVSGGGSLNERVRIDSSGRVGIGTTSPATTLHTVGTVRISRSDDAAQYLNLYASAGEGFIDAVNSNSGTNQSIIFRSGNNSATAERARIDSSGRLLVGTSSARGVATQVWGTQFEGTDYANSGLSLTINRNDFDCTYLSFGKSRGTAAGSATTVQANDNLGGILFAGADGSSLNSQAAAIRCQVDGTPGADDMPGRLVFSTTADGASSPTERMRITNGGAMLQGNTSDLTGVLGTGFKVKSNAVGSGFSAAALCLQGTGGDFYAVKFADQDMGILSVTSGATDAIQIGGSVTTASLYSNGLVQLPNVGTTASAANVFMDSASSNQLARSTSSLRYKTDIENLNTDRADAALSLRPVWYRSKATADRKDWSHYGLIAEEVAEIEPRLVNWTYLEDEYITVTNEYGIESKELKPNAKLVPDGVQYERLSVLLLSVIQRQEKRIEYLEAEIATLKAQLS